MKKNYLYTVLRNKGAKILPDHVAVMVMKLYGILFILFDQIRVNKIMFKIVLTGLQENIALRIDKKKFKTADER